MMMGLHSSSAITSQWESISFRRLGKLFDMGPIISSKLLKPIPNFPSIFESKKVSEHLKKDYVPESHHTRAYHIAEDAPLLYRPEKLNGIGGSTFSSRVYDWPRLNRLQKRYASSFIIKNQPEPYEPDFDQVRRDPSRGTQQSDPRLFTYIMVGTAGVFTAMAAKSTVLDFLTTLSAAGDTMAMAQTEVDLSAIPEGKNVVIKWRGKPVFIRHRTADEIQEAQSVDLSALRDPQPDSERTKKPEWLIMLGVCTHLGCVPLGDAGDYHGWYCPCHGSHYDISGRIRKGPAPSNLEIPLYNFIEDEKIIIG